MTNSKYLLDKGDPDFVYALSNNAQREILTIAASVHNVTDIENLQITSDGFPFLANEVESLRYQVEQNRGFSVVRNVDGLAYLGRLAESWAISNLLGRPLPQNDADCRIIEVYSRDRSQTMAHGARYHQTREGGEIHTDNVNSPEFLDYTVFVCVQPAAIGGENILVDGLQLLTWLHRAPKDVVSTLEEEFWWECRGLGGGLYRAPIICYALDGTPRFRYLRSYLEAAHRKANEPLSERQVWALDVMESALEQSDIQIRHTMRAGEIMVINDSRVLHGRTCFADPPDALHAFDVAARTARHVRRTLGRMWVKK